MKCIMYHQAAQARRCTVRAKYRQWYHENCTAGYKHLSAHN